jgi:hypothetical protein
LGVFAGLAGLRKHAASPEGQPYKEFYDRQIAKVSSLDGLFKGQAPDEGKQKFFEASTSLWENIKIFVVETLPVPLTRARSSAGLHQAWTIIMWEDGLRA